MRRSEKYSHPYNERPSHEKHEDNEDHDKDRHDKHGDDDWERHEKHGHKCNGPPFYVMLYPVLLIITMVAHRCYLVKYAYVFKKIEDTPAITVQAHSSPSSTCLNDSTSLDISIDTQE